MSEAAQHDHQFAELLQTAWSRIQHVNAEVPNLRISMGTRVRDLHPVTVPPPGDDAAERIFSALLHEAAHGLASCRNLNETSRQGRYHNSTFKSLSEELGLVVGRSPTLGWSITRLGPPARITFGADIDALATRTRSTATRILASPCRPALPTGPWLLITSTEAPRTTAQPLRPPHR